MGKLVKISAALAAMACFFAFVGCSDTDDELTNSENVTQNPENSKPDEPNLGDHTHVWDEEYADNGDGTCSRTCAECGVRSEPEEHEYSGDIYADEGHYKICTLCGTDSSIKPHVYGAYMADDENGGHYRLCIVEGCNCSETNPHTWSETYTNNGDGTHSRTCVECSVHSEPEEHKYVGSTCESCDSRLELILNMVYVQGGTFQMGSDDDEAKDNEKPVHEVTVGSFYMSKYEVTQAEWKAVMGENPSYFTGDNLPVECVSWYDAVKYCNKRSEKEGLTPCYTIDRDNVTFNRSANGYRLPTEAEWEYAAKGGKYKSLYKYSGSNNLDGVAWYEGNSDRMHEVGAKAPNALGIYDMSGNVWEWCWDWFSADYYSYSSNAVQNPLGPASGDRRVLRGGSFTGNSANGCRCTCRSAPTPEGRGSNVGFRVVRALH